MNSAEAVRVRLDSHRRGVIIEAQKRICERIGSRCCPISPRSEARRGPNTLHLEALNDLRQSTEGDTGGWQASAWEH